MHLVSRGWRYLLGLGLGGAGLYLTLRGVDLAETGRLLLQANPGMIILALISVLTNLLAKIVRWEILLGPSGEPTNRAQVARAFLSAQLLNAALPVRVGEISRVVWLGRPGESSLANGVAIDPQPGKYAPVIGSLVLEKVLDMVAYSLLILAVLASMVLPAWLAGTAFLFLLNSLLVVLVVLALLFWRQPILARLEAWLSRWPARWPAGRRPRFTVAAIHHLRLGLASLDVIASRLSLLKLVLCTGLSWGCALCANWIVARALGLELGWWQAALLLVALQAGITLPSLPTSLGIFELVCVLVLQTYGIAQPAAVSYGILLHVIVFLPVILLGTLALLVMPASLLTRS